jgi:hypothetical protein
MAQDRSGLPDFPALYRAEHLALQPDTVAGFFATAQRWQLGPLLAAGGAVVFPHVAVGDCGQHVAAAADGVLASGADKVLVIGVLHAWTSEMEQTRARVAQGEELTGHPLRGIQGPDFPNFRNEWRQDHSLIGWRYFFEAACTRRNPASRPQVREVYPFLAGTAPTTLPHFDAVARWAEDAVIVATADPFHHGIGYGADPGAAKAWDAGGRELARTQIERSHELLSTGDYAAYLQHCVATRNDARDSGPLLHALRPSQQATLIDLGWSDMTPYYHAPPPTWVVAALSTWQLT